MHWPVCVCVCVWVWGFMGILRLSGNSQISVHASASPARSHPRRLYLGKGGGNHFRRCLLYQMRLSTKLTLVKQFGKMTWSGGSAYRNPRASGRASVLMVWMPMALYVGESVRWLSSRQRAQIQRRTPLPPSHTRARTRTRTRLVICRGLQLSASTTAAAYAILT